jgi:hypothetical protein
VNSRKFAPCLNKITDDNYHMTAADVIEEIEQMPPEEQAPVIEYLLELARKRQFAGNESEALAQRVVGSDDPAEIESSKSNLTVGL